MYGIFMGSDLENMSFIGSKKTVLGLNIAKKDNSNTAKQINDY